MPKPIAQQYVAIVRHTQNTASQSTTAAVFSTLSVLEILSNNFHLPCGHANSTKNPNFSIILCVILAIFSKFTYVFDRNQSNGIPIKNKNILYNENLLSSHALLVQRQVAVVV